MMDPLSGITSVTSLVMSAVKLGKQIHDFRASFKSVPIAFEHLCTEYDSVSRLLYAYHARCMEVMNSDEDTGDPELLSGVDLNESAYFVKTTRAVEATLKVLSARIESFMSKAEPDAAEPGRFGDQSRAPALTRRKRLKFLWDEIEINKLIQYLQNYKLTLNLTLTVIAEYVQAFFFILGPVIMPRPNDLHCSQIAMHTFRNILERKPPCVRFFLLSNMLMCEFLFLERSADLAPFF
jgi:hypothetical protein